MTLAAMLLIAVFLAACGDDEESEAAEPLPKAEFVDQANEICEQGDTEIDQAAEETFTGGRPSPEQIEGFASETLVPSIQGQIDDIEALGAPEGDEEQIQEFLDKAQQALDELEADPSLLAASEGAQDPFAEVNQLADDYGLTACAG